MAVAHLAAAIPLGVDAARRRVRRPRDLLAGVPVMMYRTLRTIHLLCGVFALPMLLMYGMSAVQMAHSKWFDMKPSVTEVTVPMRSDYVDGRQLAHDIMANRSIRGDINSVQQTPAGFNVRIVVPGLV